MSYLLSEHFLKPAQDGRNRIGRQPPKALDQALCINRPQLVERDKSGPPLKPARHSPGIRLASRCHRRDHRRAEMSVEFVG
jgi:hypothetical protein